MKISGLLAEKGFHTFDGEATVPGLVKTRRVWVVTVDLTHAHVYRRVERRLELIATIEANDARTVNAGGHVFEAYHDERMLHTDRHDGKRYHGDCSFIGSLTQWLDTAEQEKAFDSLVIAAAPHALGELRYSVTPNVDRRVTAYLNKGIDQMPAGIIQQHLIDMMWF